MQQTTIENILRGDLDAYEAVVREYQGHVAGLCRESVAPISTPLAKWFS